MHKGQSQSDHTGTLYIGEHNVGIWKNRDLINAWTLSCCQAEQSKQCTCYVSHGMWVNATADAHTEVQNLTAEQRSCICRLRTVFSLTFHLSGPVHCIPAAGVGVPSSWPVTVCPHPQVAQVLRRRNDNMKENEHERDDSPDCVDCKTQLLLSQLDLRESHPSALLYSYFAHNPSQSPTMQCSQYCISCKRYSNNLM